MNKTTEDIRETAKHLKGVSWKHHWQVVAQRDELLAASKQLIEMLNDISPEQFKRGYHNPRKIALETVIAASHRQSGK